MTTTTTTTTTMIIDTMPKKIGTWYLIFVSKNLFPLRNITVQFIRVFVSGFQQTFSSKHTCIDYQIIGAF
ncbi:hypothetical protein DERF_000170 [Dermatophagoides farinae]|uniref:Uncharacterized protein n=1 Tax=Dermatophagoides farinae TaxID=6954 RepID=A0A922IC95_DERFA|nr:hypothetical protein DERF_000170 [Dermatophagoides farinae]